MVPTVHPEAAKSWAMLVDRLESEENPVFRRNLSIVAEHVVAEVAGDLDALMATVVSDPVYRFWGGAALRTLHDREEVRAFYVDSVSTGKNRLAFDISRVVVDSNTVITEGVFKHAYLGRNLPGALLDGKPLESDSWYLARYQALVVWPISGDGLIEGEDIYLGQPHQVVRCLESEELPHLGLTVR
ncbi:nuclear transport factor 2 family protein [Streptomyces sp. NPDC097610]|uniref:nuclear transport factor 2 family protein n=1 Tax=Streptomyces sp. NPDC097610 TaxID=3157227 RepID=UPI00332AB8A3